MSRLITGLDLGSSNIRAAVCRMDRTGKLNLLALDNISSNGIASGNIVDFDAARDDVANIIRGLEEKIKKKIKSVSLALSGSDIRGVLTKGMIGLSKRPRQVSGRDIDRCKKVASMIQIPIERQILQKEIHSYYINEGNEVVNPTGLYATKLTTKIYIITAEIAKIKNLYKCIEYAGYVPDSVVFSGSAIAESVLSEEEKRTGTLIIDIGSHLTNIALFQKGNLKYIDCLPSPLDFQVIKERFKDYNLSKIVITGGGVLKEDILENAEVALGVKCELGRVKLNWCPLTTKDALLHTASLGLVVYEANRLISRHRENHPFTRAIKFIDNVLESYF